MAKVLENTVRAVFGEQPLAGMHLSVIEGGAAKVLLDRCAGAVMLVVGSRGHGGFAGLLLGSVSANVAEHAACPVFIVHGDQEPPSARPHRSHLRPATWHLCAMGGWAGGMIVAFEADELDGTACCGWSVTVTGHAALTSDRAAAARCREMPLVP
jgi:Universal stress protein family